MLRRSEDSLRQRRGIRRSRRVRMARQAQIPLFENHPPLRGQQTRTIPERAKHHPNLQHPLLDDWESIFRFRRKIQTARALARLSTAVCPRRFSRSCRHLRRRPPLRHPVPNDALLPLGPRQESRNRPEATVAGTSRRRAVVKSTGRLKFTFSRSWPVC